MPTLAEYFLKLRPDASTFGAELKTKTQSAAGTAGHSSGKAFGEGMIKGLGVVFAGAAVLKFFKGAFDEAREAEKVTKLTAAVIKSTGGAAHVSAQQFAELANRLSMVAGVDDELIQSSENVLATFTRVRNEVGKGNNIFDQGTEAALNLSAALGTDLQAATILVGKALNDPIAGLTALTKRGIQFTDAQKEQIKTMVESGHTMDAQKVILAELTAKFGGAAAAAASPGDKATVAWKNFEEEVGNRLLPMLNNILTFGVKNQAWLVPMIGAVAKLGVVVGVVVLAEKAWALSQTILGARLEGTALHARRAALGMGGLLVLLTAVSAAMKTDLNPQLDAATGGMEDWASKGKLAGEASRLFGKNADDLAQSLASVTGSGFSQWFDKFVTGNLPFASNEIDKATQRVSAFDEALASMVQNGHAREAGDLVALMAGKAKVSVSDMLKVLPTYSGAVETAARGTGKLADAADKAAEAGKTLLDVWDELNGTLLSADQAMLDARKAIIDVADAFKGHTKSIKGDSSAVLENRIALEHAGRAAADAAEKYLEHGGSAKGAAKILRDFEDAAVKATGATGANAAAVRKLADQLFRIPSDVTSTIHIDTIKRVFSSTVDYRTLQRQAQGGVMLFRNFSAGGVERHIAQVAAAGAIRVWNEPEADGEAYIPLASSKRARSMDILSEVAGHFGQAVVPAGGGGGGEDWAALLAETRRTNQLLSALQLRVSAEGLALSVRSGEKRLGYAG